MDRNPLEPELLRPHADPASPRPGAEAASPSPPDSDCVQLTADSGGTPQLNSPAAELTHAGEALDPSRDAAVLVPDYLESIPVDR